MTAIAFVQAKNYTKVPVGRQIDWGVVHDMEAPEKGTTAEAVARFFANQKKGKDGSSAHYCIDNNSIVQCVLDRDVAWAAPGANHNGIHLEHAGYARQNRHEWADAFSTHMLMLSAQLMSDICIEFDLPVRFVDAVGVKAGKRGLTGHLQITNSGIGGAAGTHRDPGTNFPWNRYIRYVKAYKAGRTPIQFLPSEL